MRKGLLSGHLSSSLHPPDCGSGLSPRALWGRGGMEPWRQQPSVDLPHAEAGPTGITGPMEFSQSWSKHSPPRQESLKQSEREDGVDGAGQRWRGRVPCSSLCSLYISIKSLALLRSSLRNTVSSELQMNLQNTKVSAQCSLETWVKNDTTIYIVILYFFYVVKTKIVIL